MNALNETLTLTLILIFATGWIAAVVLFIVFLMALRNIEMIKKELIESQHLFYVESEGHAKSASFLDSANNLNVIYEKRIDAYENSFFGRDAIISEQKETITQLDNEILDRNQSIEELTRENNATQSAYSHLESLYNGLEAKITKKNQPRDEGGHFLGKPRKNPDIGKYLCIIGDKYFIKGSKYPRYIKKSDNEPLNLIGEDRMRHSVESHRHCFQLIEA